jgi:RimJ/RimL family protein N-acetyltransferase
MIASSQDHPATAALNTLLLTTSCELLIKELGAERDALDEAQITRLAEEIIRPGGWPWSMKIPRGREAAEDLFSHYRGYMRDSRRVAWKIARAEKLLKTATTSGVTDIRLSEDDIILLRPYLGASDIV